MRQFRLSSSERSEKGPAPGFKERLVNNWQLIFVLSMIMLIALILRVFFAYDVAVAGGYAFSGGSGAAYHAAVIESIMESWRHVIYDSSLNYPYSELNVNPPLMDWTYAIIAKIVTLFGVSSSTAVAGTLVWSTAILGTLTCIPVYYLAKEMFGHKAGIVSALMYAICAVVISQTVLSNGTEAAFYGFFFVIMLIYLLRAVRAVSNESFERRKGESKSYFRSIFGENRAAMKNAVIAGIFMALVALSWNGFRPVFVMVCAIMIAQVVADRIRKKDPTSAVFTYATVLVIGTLISAPIYAAVGLWSAVYSGVFLIVILSIISALVISETKNRPWLLVIPILVVIIAVFMIVLWFALPDLFSCMVNGNSIYTDPTFSSLVGMNSSTSLSAMAAYYGWLTMWFPYLLICLMVYKLREQFTSPEKSFIFFWLVAMIVLGWSTSMNVYLVAPAYVIGVGAILAMLLDKADIPAYFASFRGSGFNVRQFLKNLFRPLPLGTILTVVLLVGAPNAMYAIDAASPSNSSDTSGAFGYYVKNDSDWNLNDMWDSFSGEDKDGALLTYWDYSAEASLKGGFDSVAGTNGNGASAASNMLLSSGGAESNVAMALRLIEYHGLDKFETYLKTDLGFTDADYDDLEKIMYDPESVKNTILSNPDAYGKYSSLSDENAMYIGAIMFLTGDPGVAYEGRIETLDRSGAGALTEIETIGLYEKACELSGKDISYLLVTRGMIPLMYGDGSSFSTLAYMNNFYLDANGSPTEFYTLNYNGYYNYTAAMYETLLWKTYFGPSPSELGHSSAVSMMNAFAASDGSAGTRPIPGFGMVNYEVAYWKVLYSENSEAEEGSDDWEEMDAYDAMAIQDTKIEAGEDPGLINFMSGLPIVLKYVSCENAKTVKGTVTSSAAGTPPVEGVRVTLFDSNGVQRMTTFTDENGTYELCVPFEKGRIEITVGTTGSITGGLKVTEKEFDESTSFVDPIDFEVKPVEFTGQIFYDDTETEPLKGNLKFKIEGAAHGGSETVESPDGTFSFTSSTLVPDTYTLTVTDEGGNTVCTATYNPVLNSGEMIKVNAYLSTGTLNLTINDEYGSPISSEAGTQHVKLTSQDLSGGTPYSRIVKLENGKATAKVVPGTYVATLVNEDGTPDANREIFGNPVSVSSGSSATLTAKVQEFATIELTNDSGNILSVSVTNGSYSSKHSLSSAAPDNVLEVRVPVGLESVDYYVSATYTDAAGDSKIWWDKYSLAPGQTVAEATGVFTDAYEFSGTVRSTSGTAVSSYVTFYPQSADLPMISVWSSAGEVYALVPAGGYVIHAYGSSSSLNEAYLGKFTMPAGTSKGGYIDLEKAKTLTISVLYTDSGSGKLPYVPVSINESDRNITIPAVTNGDGSYSKLVPYGNYKISVAKNLSNGMTVEGTPKNGMVVKTPADATSTLTVTFRATDPTLYTGIFNIFDQNNVKLDEGTEITFKLKATYSVENKFDVKADGTIDFGDYQLIVGEYTVTIDKKDGYYLNENVTLSINGGDVTMNAKKLDTITFGNLTEKDKVTVTALGDEKGWYGSDDYDEKESEQVYYFETGKQFSIMVNGKNDTDNKTVWYYYHNNVSNPAVSVIADKAVDLVESFDLKGYVGYAGTGILEIRDGLDNLITILDVTSGKYTVELPVMEDADEYRFEAFMEPYVDDTDPDNPVTEYTYTGSGVMDEQPESGVFNFIVLGKPDTDADTKPLTVTSSDIVDKSDRTVTFKLTVSGDEYRSLFLSGGSGWESIKFYSDAALTLEIGYANIADVPAPGNLVVVYAEAVYKDDVALDSGLTVELKDAAGESILSHVVDITSVVTPTHSLTIGKGENDNFGENDYLFSIVLKNEGYVAERFVLTYLGGDAPAGWYLVFVSSDGKMIYDSNDGTAEFSVPGMSEMTVYAKLVNKDAEKLPAEFDIDLEVISAILEDDIEVDEEFGKAVQSGKTVKLTIVPGTTELDAGDGNASGPNIFMDGGSLPTYVWAMVALSILLFIVILWQGMKRGVFSRRK